MRLLLDTHALLWFGLGDSQLSSVARTAMVEATNDLLLSPASYWELAIKVRLGKYAIGQDFRTFMEEQIQDNNLTILPITVAHAEVITTLPMHHRDPFDRLLIAQAQFESLSIVSSDAMFDLYGIQRLW